MVQSVTGKENAFVHTEEMLVLSLIGVFFLVPWIVLIEYLGAQTIRLIVSLVCYLYFKNLTAYRVMVLWRLDC